MPDRYCPQCSAPLAESYVRASVDLLDCPTCGETIELASVAPDLARRRANEAEPFLEDPAPSDRLHSRVAGDQLVIAIAAGAEGPVRRMRTFLLALWAAVLATTFVIVHDWNGWHPEAIEGLAVLGAGWASVLGLTGYWLYGRFARTLVLVESDRLVKKSTWFGFATQRTWRLNQYSEAGLRVAYTENDDPVHCVWVSATGGPVRFGEFLRPEEKAWVVARINRHLGREAEVEESAAVP